MALWAKIWLHNLLVSLSLDAFSVLKFAAIGALDVNLSLVRSLSILKPANAFNLNISVIVCKAREFVMWILLKNLLTL